MEAKRRAYVGREVLEKKNKREMRSINLRGKKRKDVKHVSQGRKTWSSVSWDGLLGPW